MRKAVRLNIPLKSWDEFVPDVLPDIEWVIEGLFERDSIVSLYGPSNEGKSFVALSIAYAVAMGIPWLENPEFRTDKWKGPVVYLAAEGQRGTRRRCKAIMLYYTPPTQPEVSFKETAVQIWKEADLNAFLKEIKSKQPVLIIIDTLARTSVGMDENDNAAMNVYVDAADQIRAETGACVLIVHHTKKNRKKGEAMQERGGYALRCAVDTAICCTKHNGIITLACAKIKDGKSFDDILVTLKDVEVKPAHDDVKAQISAVVVPMEDGLPSDIDPRRQAAFDALNKSTTPLTLTEWRESAMVEGKLIPKATFYRLVKSWLHEELIEEIGDDGRYRLKLV